eukprot:377895-Pelagomonas_calceolata.AAC.1
MTKAELIATRHGAVLYSHSLLFAPTKIPQQSNNASRKPLQERSRNDICRHSANQPLRIAFFHHQVIHCICVHAMALQQPRGSQKCFTNGIFSPPSAIHSNCTHALTLVKPT